MRRRVIIMGAGGRDFHNFNVFFRDNPGYDVVAFTAAQIPFIAYRTYPPSLAGGLYPKGIPIHPEEKLPGLIRSLKADAAVFAYSDVSGEYVMHKASETLALGADFVLLGPRSTMLKSRLPVISVCAVRTGCGKSPVTRRLLHILKDSGRKPVAIRHPMAYCDLERQRVERFGSIFDLEGQICTVEEREEYEHLVEDGFVVYSGVDYADVLREAEKEADIIVWDGGNNDFPFITPDLEIVVADALRPGHTLTYHPGETNFRMADVIVINKAGRSSAEGVKQVKTAAKKVNPDARIIVAGSPVLISPGGGASLKGKKALVVEDGPTLTHGGMSFGAGYVAATEAGAIPVSPLPYARGTLKEALARYPHVREVLPAMGYSKAQLRELEAAINRTPCDLVLFSTPVNLGRLITIRKPAFRVTYSIKETGSLTLSAVVRSFLKNKDSL